MGGIVRIWALPPADIRINGNRLTILNSENSIAIYTTPGTAGFSEEANQSSAGLAYNTEIWGTVPGDNPATSSTITLMERVRKYVVVFLDGNDNFKLAGTNKVPLRFSSGLATGNTSSELNHYRIQFKGLQPERAVFIDKPPL